MSRPSQTPTLEPPTPRRSRLALPATLILGLAMSLTLLGVAHSTSSYGAEAEPEAAGALEEEDWWTEEECEGPECEFGEGETEAFDPAECFLLSTRARVIAPLRHGALRVKVRYRTAEPVTAYVNLRLRGPRGLVDLGLEKRRLGLRGTFVLHPRLSPARMEIARNARYFLLTVEVPGAPTECRDLLTERLPALSRGPGRRVWAG